MLQRMYGRWQAAKSNESVHMSGRKKATKAEILFQSAWLSFNVIMQLFVHNCASSHSAPPALCVQQASP